MATTRLATGSGKRVNYRKLAGMKKKAPRRPRVMKPSPALKSMVKSIVNSTEEVNRINSLVDNGSALYNSLISSGDVKYLLPTMVQGDTAYQRHGDRVTPKSLIVKLHVSPPTGSGGFPTIQVRIHFLKHKKFTNRATLGGNASTEVPKLLDNGSGTQLPYDGTILASQYQLNTDIWTDIKTLNFTISKDNVSPTTGAPFREFTVRIPCPKHLTYQDATAQDPENFCPIMLCGYMFPDGTAPDTVVPKLRVVSQSFFTYTDA